MSDDIKGLLFIIAIYSTIGFLHDVVMQIAYMLS